jgi:hydrogenase maturation factor
MIQNILKNWNFVRLLRLAMGIFLVVEAVKSGMWILVAVGAVLLQCHC